MKKILHIPIQLKITLLSFGIIVFSIIIGGLIVLGNVAALKEEEIGKRSMITAHTVAEMPEVKTFVQKDGAWNQLNPIIEKLRIIHNADYIVVLNQQKIRYSHPVREKLGTVSTGSDEVAAFAEHVYLSKAQGELGVSVRAFVPIIDQNNEQVGVVMVGNIVPTFWNLVRDFEKDILVVLLLPLLFGICGSWILGAHIKRETFHLEPHQISRLLVERTAAFNAMHEGVIAIDSNEIITIFNEKAKQMLGIKGDVVGKQIRDVVSDTRLPEILESTQAIYNQEIQIQHKNIVSNRVPIKVDNKIVGAVAIFQDRTEVTKMAEELTGVKAFVEALRVQNHEHMNKLHTIAGLIQLGNLEQALQFVFQTTEEQEELTRFLSKKIHHDSIAGLLISKVSRGKELGIELIIDKNTSLQEFPENLDHHDFVHILGNLIENSFAALQMVQDDRKQVFVSIIHDENYCEIIIEDNGCGIPDSILNKIFDYGYTTKGSNGSGIGLYLVSQIVEKGNGEIEIHSSPNEGTTFYISFPMSNMKEANHG